MKDSSTYDLEAFFKYLALTIMMVVSFKVTSGFAALILPGLTLIALLNGKPIALMFWVLFMTVSSAGNAIVFARGPVTVMTARVTLVVMTFLAASKVFGSRNSRVMMPLWGIMPYMLWECIVSLQGYSPIISYLKLTLFFCIFFAMFGVANEVNASSRDNARILRSAILAIVALMMIGSVLLIPFPSISLMTEKADLGAMLAGEAVSLFCGMCCHSQAMGPMAGVLGTFILADLLFSVRKWDSFYVCMLLCCPIVAWKSSSRTGMGTLVAGVGMVVILFLLSRGVSLKWKGKVVLVLAVLAIVGSIVTLTVPKLRERVAGFVVKAAESRERREVSMENMFSSRQGKIEVAMYNFRKKPLQGNGFQVSEEMAHERRETVASYFAAPIEKGVWMYAILEEGGVIGMILFC